MNANEYIGQTVLQNMFQSLAFIRALVSADESALVSRTWRPLVLIASICFGLSK
jgi:hypothetical protein